MRGPPERPASSQKSVTHVPEHLLPRSPDETQSRSWWHIQGRFQCQPPDPLVVERVRYDAYGRGEHRWPGDLNDDGVVDSDDEDMFLDPNHTGNLGTPEYNVALDINRDGVIDAADEVQFAAHALFWGFMVLEGQISYQPGSDNSVGYAGYIYNTELQLYTVRFRTYSPELGRWLQRDPLGPVDGVNVYQYVRSSPVLLTDPLGLLSPPPPGRGDPNGVPSSKDPRNDPSKGCGVAVYGNDLGNKFGHRWIEIDDPVTGESRLGYWPTTMKGAFGGRGRWLATGADPADSTDTCLCDPTSEDLSLHYNDKGDTRWFTTVHGKKAHGILEPWLQFGDGVGTLVSDATCDQIRNCIHRYVDPYGYFYGLHSCRGAVDEALNACGLERSGSQRRQTTVVIGEEWRGNTKRTIRRHVENWGSSRNRVGS
jgi:RHS repeat-associated protein